MPLPIVYTVFHINMAFSSIEEGDRAEVIKKCYWPLLGLAEAGLPIGIEATSYSLKVIKDLDPKWIEKLRELIQKKRVEFVGSGYVQMIAPLVPPEVTRWNLKLAKQDYQEILGIVPQVALVNEQAYSPGLVPLYLEAGYDAIMMDWSEPSSHNKSWKKSYSHQPQQVQGADGSTITVLWSDAISFQKFQRYAHGELDAEEYLDFLSLHLTEGVKTFPLYTSDAEVFDYRPGRFADESDTSVFSEYERIQLLLEALNRSDGLTIGLPRDALELRASDSPPIRLETAAAPVPVKKQRKYNLLRWAVSGQSDLALNTHCWRLYEALRLSDQSTDADWRELCGYWASDFRTHITEKRWQDLNSRLPSYIVPAEKHYSIEEKIPDTVSVELNRRFLIIETPDMHVVLNAYRGLAVHSFGMGQYSGTQAGAPIGNGLLGTMAHGYYDDIAFGADFYTGHFIFEPAGRHKVTDLVRVQPSFHWRPDIEAVAIECLFETPWGQVTKNILCYTKEKRLHVSYGGAIPLPLDGSFRLGHMTLNPRAFEAQSLYYASHNGGEGIEKHALWGEGLIECDHGAAVSRLISATTGVGMTSGYLELGDKSHFVRLHMCRADAAGVGLVSCRKVDDTFFARAAISLCEVDETLRRNLSPMSTNVKAPKLGYALEIGEHS